MQTPPRPEGSDRHGGAAAFARSERRREARGGLLRANCRKPLHLARRAAALFAAALSFAAPAFALPGPFSPPVREGSPAAVRRLATAQAERLRRARAAVVRTTASQDAVDVRTYALDLTCATSAQAIAGAVTVRATVVTGPLATFDLDLLDNMVVDSVTVGEAPAAFTHAGGVLATALDRPYAPGEDVVVRVMYHGTPATTGPFGGAFGFAPVHGRTLVWSLSEPYGARSWWPCKDTPSDKADSVDVVVRVPGGMRTASNGTRLSESDDGITSVTHWRERHPIATYLVSVTSYPYVRTTAAYLTAAGGAMPIEFYNYPEDAPSAASVQSRVAAMIAAYAARCGEYPFADEKYGHAQFEFGGGMEHQTCTSLGQFDEWVVAHELGHQWWGDAVTCRDFHEIWLNEGFATYMEALWAEAEGGSAAYHDAMAGRRYLGPGTVWVADTTDEARIFDYGLSYERGAWVLHMLRHVLGDSTFFRALRTYRAAHVYATATTGDLRAACEAESGRDLSRFFTQWVYGEGVPVYRPAWTSAPAPAGWDVTLTLAQEQAGPPFAMPVDVRVLTTAGTQDLVVQDSLATQEFTLHVDAPPLSVAIDPDEWILRTLDAPVVHAPLDRAVLLVNGVTWPVYASEMAPLLAAKAFWGDYAIDFWDCFPEPAAGYASTLPAPLGHGAVPADVLGRFRNVIWLSSDWQGDHDLWWRTPILSYLRAGGNVLLLTRAGYEFLDDSLRARAGITWTVLDTTIADCEALPPWLADLAPNAQTRTAVFDTAVAPGAQLLFATRGDPPMGFGVLGPPGAGGRFAFLSGRPYRWDAASLRTDVQAILANGFDEPLPSLATPPAATPATALAPPAPSPFTHATTLRFTLARRGPAALDVLDLAGRRVRTLAGGTLDAGPHAIAWDGRDAQGREVGAGVYWARLAADGVTRVQKVVRLP